MAARRLVLAHRSVDGVAAARGGIVGVAHSEAVQRGVGQPHRARFPAPVFPRDGADLLACAAASWRAILYLFTTTIHTGVLGALLTFARSPLYAPFDAGLRVFGALSPLEDQQLGGLIMWVPGALVYMGVALTLLARWLGESARTTGDFK